MTFHQVTRNQRGALIIWLALFLIVLLGFVAIGIDMAKLAATQGQLQTAADAAALAGATAIDAVTGKIVKPTAISRAQATGAGNKAYELLPTSVQIDAGDISFPADSQIKVIARRAGATGMVTHFAAAFLGSAFHKLDMNAMAVAVVQPASGSCCGLVPVAAVPLAGGAFLAGCTHIYDLRAAPGSGTGGNYGFVDFPACSLGACANMPTTGASTFRCYLANGYCCCISIGQQLNTEPGSMDGPMRQGLQQRWDGDTDQTSTSYEGGCGSAAYHGNGNRLFQVPITTPIIQPGRSVVTVTGIANFFLVARPSQAANNPSIQAEFVDKVVPGTGGGGGSTGSSYVIRLIK